MSLKRSISSYHLLGLGNPAAKGPVDAGTSLYQGIQIGDAGPRAELGVLHAAVHAGRVSGGQHKIDLSLFGLVDLPVA